MRWHELKEIFAKSTEGWSKHNVPRHPSSSRHGTGGISSGGAARQDSGGASRLLPGNEAILHLLNALVAVTVVFGAALFALGNFLLGLYLGKASFSSTYGAASSTVVLGIWVYYSSQIFSWERNSQKPLRKDTARCRFGSSRSWSRRLANVEG